MENEALIAQLVKELDGRQGPGIIFVGRRVQAEEMARELAERLGHQVGWMTSQRPQKIGRALADQMRRGELQLVVATSTWSTGLDIPGLKYVVLTGKDKAPIWLLQSVGRGMRVDEGKQGFDIINMVEPGMERQAKQRAETLAAHGLKTEEGFLDELEQIDQQRRTRQPELSMKEIFVNMVGPAWVWKVGLPLAALLGLARWLAE